MRKKTVGARRNPNGGRAAQAGDAFHLREEQPLPPIAGKGLEFVAGEGFPGSAGAGTTASGTGGSSRTRVVKGFGTMVREPLPALSPARSALSLGGTRPAKA